MEYPETCGFSPSDGKIGCWEHDNQNISNTLFTLESIFKYGTSLFGMEMFPTI